MSSFRTIELSDPRYEKDGLRYMTIKSANLKGRGDLVLYVPEVEMGLSNLPIYILLHGVYGSAWAWSLKGGAHKTAAQMIKDSVIQPAIIAMPSDGLWGDGSAYFSHHELQFDRWIVEDVPLAIQEHIPEAGLRSPLCLGGLSMGGYGALMLGARFSDKFKAISGHSSITRLEEMTQFVEEPLEAYTQFSNLPNVIDVIQRKKEKLPSLRFDCGTNDPLIEGNRLLNQELEALAIPHIYEEFEGGHEWPYWEEHVRESLLFFDKSITGN